MRTGKQEEDMLCYLSFEEVEGDLDMMESSGLVYTDSDDDFDFDMDFDEDIGLEKKPVGGTSEVVHTQPVHLLEVHHLRTLQKVFEEQVETEDVLTKGGWNENCMSNSTAAHTRKNSVFSSAQSVEAVDCNEVFVEDKCDVSSGYRGVVGLLNTGDEGLGAGFDDDLELVEHAQWVQESQLKGLPDRNNFVYSVTNKLLPYFGYFLADSNELDYFDKIRYQEIDYKFSKTYF